jgi:ferrous iron transport protein B
VSDRPLTVALAGNPNSGKTTIFNRLTGARQHVGNYPGVTVEKVQGDCTHKGVRMHVVDLPGTYSLTAYSVEELVARDFIIEGKPDVVVDIVDSSNLERNLYLATQLMELDAPLVLAFNMSDSAKARGFEFDIEALSRLLGVPIVLTIGHKGTGMDELLDTVIDVAGKGARPASELIQYGAEIEEEIAKLLPLVEGDTALADTGRSRWVALKLLENDKEVLDKMQSQPLLEAVSASTAHLERVLGDSPEIVVADRRYGFISGACQETVRSTVEARHYFSDQVDNVLAHRIVGLPIFLALMYLVFQLTFTLGEAPMGWLESLFAWSGDAITHLWPKTSDSALRSLLVDGIIGGVGGVIVFLPNIILLFFAISLLEDSGYMARAAFVMDQFMHKFDLHGKSFIPMLIGFGCSVPAILATRTLENQRDRLTTMLVTPLMSCGARLPIYALIIPAFFAPSRRAPMLMLIYMIGIALALITAKVLRSTVLRGESTPFVMELPPYRLPTARGAFLHTWGRSWMYLKKAGTVILAISILLWALTSYPKKSTYGQDYDAKAAEATAAYLDGVEALGPELGLPPDSGLLVRAFQANLDMATEQAAYFEDEPGFAAAVERRDAALQALKTAPHGEVLAKLLRYRDSITRIRSDFQVAVEKAGIDEGSEAYLVLEHRTHTALENLADRDPVTYAAALRYVDEIKASYDALRTRIDQERGGEDLAYSAAGRLGHAIEPALRPLGFDWKIGTALIGALAAKEVFVAQLGIVYSVGEADEGSDALRAQLRAAYTPLIAFCIMLFCLVSAPCMATIAVTRSESNSTKWALFQLGGLTAIAYVLTFTVYQVGSLLGIGTG